MKLIIAIVQDEDAGRLINTMMKEGYGITKLATTGGFLRSGNTTLLAGVEEEKLDECLGIIENVCKSRKQVVNAGLGSFNSVPMNAGVNGVEITVGGATVFVMDVECFKKY